MPSSIIGRFNIQESPDRNHEIQGLSWRIDSENIVTLEWKWPVDICYKMAVIMEAESPTDRLEDLLTVHPDPVIITRSMDKKYIKPITSEKQQFKVYPAKFGEGNEIIIIDQKEHNITEPLFRKIKIDCHLTYQRFFFSGYQKVNLQTKIYGDLNPGSLVYEKFANGRSICLYPLENVSKDIFFYIKKDESIKIKAAEPYQNILEINSVETLKKRTRRK